MYKNLCLSRTLLAYDYRKVETGKYTLQNTLCSLKESRRRKKKGEKNIRSSL